MADGVATPAPQSLDTLLTEIQGETEKLQRQIEKAEDQRQSSEIVASVSVITDRLPKVTTAVKELKDALAAATTSPEKGPLTGTALKREKNDEGFRLGVVVVLAVFGGVAACRASDVAGWIATVGADAYLGIILWAAAIRSDTTYGIKPSTKECLSRLKPTKLLAPLFIACLFVALWLGFAGLYGAAVAPNVAPVALGCLYQSFMTLTTLAEPANVAGIRELVMFQIGSALLYFIGIFALFINRISEF